MLSDFMRQKMTHYFKVLDNNSNGVLDQTDFINVAENLAILRSIDSSDRRYRSLIKSYEYQWEEIHESLGKPSSAKIKLDEWLTYVEDRIVNGSDEHFYNYINALSEEAIINYDVNRDGFISVKEFIVLFIAYNIQVKDSVKIFQQLDLNGDGLINKQELIKAFEQFFSSNDSGDPGNWLFGFWTQ